MPLPLPRLDDRTFDPLLEEAREMLPSTAPRWTDHNFSDPGITLVELLAYLTELDSYRLDRIPPAQQRAYLRLLGYAPRRARAATTVLTFIATAAPGATRLPAGVQISVEQGSPVFQTTATLDVSAAKLTTVLSFNAGEYTNQNVVDSFPDQFVEPLGSSPIIDDALYIGFDQSLGLQDSRVRLYLFAEDLQEDMKTWSALAESARLARKTLFAQGCCDALPNTGHYWEHYGVQLVWEYYDQSGTWRELDRVKDRTRALSISGPVHFRAPGIRHVAGGVTDGSPGHSGTFFIRCRVISGTYDCAPRIRGIRVNAVAARHAADVAGGEAPGSSSGHAHQRYQLKHTPIVPASSRLTLQLQTGETEQWQEFPDFDRSGPHARHYVLDPQAGTIEFGDGQRGQVPPVKANIQIQYRVGSGETGNVSATTLSTLLLNGVNAGISGWSIMHPALEVSQPVMACGGKTAETIPDAMGRAVRSLANSRCAVTLRDFERFAQAVPGVPVARVHAIANFHPRHGCLPAAGCVTVVIVPRCARVKPEPYPESYPKPSSALCCAVRKALEVRRPVTGELHVAGPKYTKVGVHVKLRLRSATDRAAAVVNARAALCRYFDLMEGGPENKGWPVGRNVYRSEVLALLNELPGVEHVYELKLKRDNEPEGSCGNVELCPDGLLVSGEHRIEID